MGKEAGLPRWWLNTSDACGLPSVSSIIWFPFLSRPTCPLSALWLKKGQRGELGRKGGPSRVPRMCEHAGGKALVSPASGVSVASREASEGLRGQGLVLWDAARPSGILARALMAGRGWGIFPFFWEPLPSGREALLLFACVSTSVLIFCIQACLFLFL